MTSAPQDQITIYTPGSALRQPSRLLADMFRDIWRGRGLAWRLAVRDISAQYRQAALGLMWALILPLANTAAWIFLDVTRRGLTPNDCDPQCSCASACRNRRGPSIVEPIANRIAERKRANS